MIHNSSRLSFRARPESCQHVTPWPESCQTLALEVSQLPNFTTFETGGFFRWGLIRGGSPHALWVHPNSPYYHPPSPTPNMTTLKNDHSPECWCTCPPNVHGTNVGIAGNCIVAMPHGQTSSVGTWPNSSSTGSSLLSTRSTSEPLELSPTTTMVLRGWDRSFESLQSVLSSKAGRESLYALPTDQAVGVIDVLEQVSAKRFGCVITG